MKPKGCADHNHSHKWKQRYFRTFPLLADRGELAALPAVALCLPERVQYPGSIAMWSGVSQFLISPLE